MLGPAPTANWPEMTIADERQRLRWYVRWPVRDRQRRPDRAAASTATRDSSRPTARATDRRNRPRWPGRPTAAIRGVLHAGWGRAVMVAAGPGLAGAGATDPSTARLGRIGMTVPPGAGGRNHDRGTREVAMVTPATGAGSSPQGGGMDAQGGSAVHVPRVSVLRSTPTGMAMTRLPDGCSVVTRPCSRVRTPVPGGWRTTWSGDVRAPNLQDTGTGGAAAIRMVARTRTPNTSALPVAPTCSGAR
jgi:hypothetical protein